MTQQRELLLLARKTYKTHMIIMQDLLRDKDGSECSSAIACTVGYVKPAECQQGGWSAVLGFDAFDTFRKYIRDHINSISYNHGSYFTNSSRDKKHRVTLQLKWRSVWGRGWNHLCPYASVGTQFARVVILLGDPTEEDVPRGRARAVICDAQCEAPVAIRTGITSQEVRTTILYAIQAQGYLQTVT